MEIPQIVRTYTENFTPDGLDRWISTFAADGTYSDPRTAQPIPKDGPREYFTGSFAGFPDLRCETVGLDAISEHVWVWRFVMRGTHTAPLRGIPATGRSVAMPACEFIEIRGDRVHRVEGYFDRLTLLSQLGLSAAV